MPVAALGALASGGMSASTSQQTSFAAMLDVNAGLNFGSYNGGVATMGGDPPALASLTGGNPWLVGGLIASVVLVLLLKKGGK